MRRTRYAFLAFGVFLTATAAARADDAAAARALIDKGIQAQGGDGKLAKLPGVTAKFKGTFHGTGAAIAMTGEVVTHGREKLKFVIEFEVMGQRFRVIHILNGDKGWTKVNDDTKAFDKDELAEAREVAHSEWVATLYPLKDKAFTLATVGEINIDKRPALGVRASSKDRRDVNLFFDKETNLLVKTEKRVKNESGQEVNEETFLSDYKEVQGTKQAVKFTVKRDGKPYMEGEVGEYQLEEKLDDSAFAKP